MLLWKHRKLPRSCCYQE